MSVREELERIRLGAGGILAPEAVVEAARPKGSPLHNSFTWDDGEAAEKWRLHQARNLIRVYVQILPANGKEKEARLYVSLSTDRYENGGYRAMVDVLGDSLLREQLLADAKGDMIRFRQKYGVLNELAEVFEAMDRTVKKFVDSGGRGQALPGLKSPGSES